MKRGMLALMAVVAILLSLGVSKGAAQVPYTVIDSDPNRYPALTGVWLFPSHNHIVRDSSGKIYVAYSLATNQSVHYYNYVRWSSNGGATWSDPVRTEDFPDSSSVQSLVIDSSNVLYEGFTCNVSPLFTKSTDGGQTWSRLDLDWNPFRYQPSLVIDGSGTLHVTYDAAYGWLDYPFNIIYKNSTDGGANWSQEAYLTSVPHDVATYGFGARSPDLYAGKEGNLFILYSDYATASSPYPVTKMFLHFDGTTWSDPLQVSTDDIPFALFTSAQAGDLAVDSTGIAHIAYPERDAGTGNHRIVYRTYDPVAKTFSSPRTLTPATVNISSISMGVYSGDRIVIAYDLYNETANEYGGVYSLTSADDFTSAQRISTHPNARTPNLRSSFYTMNQPDKIDLIWVEPNDVSGGEDLAYTELSGGIPDLGSLLVNVYGPKIANPGQESVYLVRYRNGLTVDSENTVVKVSLPGNLPFVSCTGGGVYLRQTNEVVWNLGTVPAGGQGNLAFTLYIPWGEPNGSAAVVAKIDSTNSPWHILDVSRYLNPVGIEVASERFLTNEEIASLFASDGQLQTLHTLALGRGFGFYNVVKDILLTDGRTLRLFAYVKGEPSFELMFLRGIDGQYSLVRRNETGTEFFDDKGGLILRLDGAEIPYGEWSNPDYEGPYGPYGASVLQEGLFAPSAEPEISYFECLRNCAASKASDVAAGGIVGTAYNVCKMGKNVWERQWKEAGKDCIGIASGAAGAVIDALEGAACPVICLSKKNRKEYYCPFEVGVVYEKTCASDSLVRKKTCSALHMFNPVPTYWACLTGQRCVEGECVDKGAVCPVKSKSPSKVFSAGPSAPPAGGGNSDMCDDEDSDIVPAHDPNAKSVDPKGDVVPGQTLTYTIEYENTGAGTAFGVFVLDTLDPNLDESTLSIGGGGGYIPSERLLSWDIGTLPPSQQGAVTATIKVKEGLPSGTAIVNMAEVHFPSAAEITPTNPVVNVVRAIAADPKEVETVSGTPVLIVLSGRDSGSNPITYRISTDPIYGDLAGSPPTVTYSAMAEFSGQDEFYYVVGNGLVESAPAKVIVRVAPDLSHRTPPSVIGTYPADGTQKVHFDTTPLSTNPYQYTPTVTATFSEPIDTATLTAGTFTVDGVTGNVSYDAPSMTAFFKPSSPLSANTPYTARLSTGIKDKAGNPMANYAWQFTTESPASIVVSLPDNASELNFGSLPIGQSTGVQIVTVTNTGTQDLLIGTLSRSGANPDDFVVTDNLCSGATLPQSVSCTVKVAFSPKGAGSRSGQLAIPSNDLVTPFYAVPLTGAGIQQYTLTVTHSSGGTVTPGTKVVNSGTDQIFSIIPDTGYHVVDVLVDGASQGPVLSVSFTSVTANHTLSASFAINTYILTVTHSSGGTVTPGTKTVNYGTDQTFSIIPDTGYHVVDVLVDGASQGAILSYTFTSVAASHSIEAFFAINTYILTVTHSVGGTVTPGTKTVNYGTDQAFSIIPDTGYHVVDVMVDGVSQGPILSHTFASVATDHTLSAFFAIDTHILTVTVNGAGKGTVTGSGVDCGNGHTVCTPVYDYNTVVTLTPHPDSASVFSGWSGSGCSGRGLCTVTMDTAKSVTATFSYFVVDPPQGTYGTEIVITGPGFGIKKGKVLLDTVSLKVLSWNDGEIHGVLRKPILPGSYPITVQPKGVSIREETIFTVSKPSDLSVDPKSGVTGATITLSGKFLGTKKGKVYLEYEQGGVTSRKACKVVQWPTTPAEGTGEGEVRFVVPKGIPSSSVCDLIVSNPMGETRLTDGFSVP
jgi:uncharacterized repeat protein (TIGR01451 family)